MTIENSKQFPKRFFARHMVSGVVGYENEKILVDNTAIARMNNSFEGKPVYVNHQTVSLDTLREDADGYVVKSFFNEKDSWFWAEILVTSDAGVDAVKKGWAVSNAYIPTEFDKGGSYLNVDYNRKVANGEFTHLAIVPNPRYEESVIFTPEEFKNYQESKKKEWEELHNSKPKGNPMLKMFKKAVAQTEVTNEADITDDAVVHVGDMEFTVAELKEVHNAKKKAKKNDDADMEELDNEDEDGEDIKDDLKKNKKTKKNAEDESDADAKKDEKQNAKAITQADLDAAVAKATADAIEGMKNFTELKNAGTKKQPVIQNSIETSQDRLARGAERY